jgi:hypothetical protein
MGGEGESLPIISSTGSQLVGRTMSLAGACGAMGASTTWDFFKETVCFSTNGRFLEENSPPVAFFVHRNL